MSLHKYFPPLYFDFFLNSYSPCLLCCWPKVTTPPRPPISKLLLYLTYSPSLITSPPRGISLKIWIIGMRGNYLHIGKYCVADYFFLFCLCALALGKPHFFFLMAVPPSLAVGKSSFFLNDTAFTPPASSLMALAIFQRLEAPFTGSCYHNQIVFRRCRLGQVKQWWL